MIAVVADDLTGAAELGGIGLRYNLKVEIGMQVNSQTQADLLIISTDTRSKNKDEAQEVTEKVMQELISLRPELIYKKIDSVLRGHVLPEMEAQLRVLNCKRALLVPANPSLGRTISNGTYYFKGVPIHQSSFSKDPEFPLTSSRVLDILRPAHHTVSVLNHSQPLPDAGIVIGEVNENQDLNAWAQFAANDTALAGASGFFTAILEAKGYVAKENPAKLPLTPEQPGLFICGSTFGKSRALVKALQESGGPVSYMPKELILAANNSDNQIANWAKEITLLLGTKKQALLAIDPTTTAGVPVNAATLREIMARAVQLVCKEINIAELYVEGGSTAAAILKRLGLNRFYPQQELAPGVIRMQVAGYPGLGLTIKPGSYDWPAAIWNFN